MIGRIELQAIGVTLVSAQTSVVTRPRWSGGAWIGKYFEVDPYVRPDFRSPGPFRRVVVRIFLRTGSSQLSCKPPNHVDLAGDPLRPTSRWPVLLAHGRLGTGPIGLPDDTRGGEADHVRDDGGGCRERLAAGKFAADLSSVCAVAAGLTRAPDLVVAAVEPCRSEIF